ncbi:MAG: hypothetical protein ABIJ74_01745 [archaeon]
MNKTVFFLLRTAVFLTGFVLVAYGMVFFGEYLGEFRDYYFKTGDYAEVLVLILITLGIGYVLRKLLLSVYRKEAGITRRRK